MKLTLTLAVLAAVCYTSHSRLVRSQYGSRPSTHEVEDTVEVNEETIDQILKDLMKTVEMTSTTTTTTTESSVPESLDPFAVDIVNSRRRPFFHHRHHPHPHPWESENENEVEREEVHPANMSSIFSIEFMETHDQWTQSCMKNGCKLCQVARNRQTGESAENCRGIPPMMGMGVPIGRRLFARSSKLTMRPHGFMEYRMEYSMRGQEDKTFKVTLIEVMEAIKKVMVAKEMMQDCKPKLDEFTDNDLVADSKADLPDAMSGEFVLDMESLAKQVLEDGGNFCLGTKSASSNSNCMTINWKPACGVYQEGKPTIRLLRYQDDAVIVVSYDNEEGQVQEKSYRLTKKDWIEHKQAINALFPMLVSRSSQDPIAVQQFLDLVNDTFDFGTNNVFRH